MGLDVSHNCWHGSYGNFMCWRKAVANCIGIPLELMEGFFSWESIDNNDIADLKPPENMDGSFAQWAADLHRAACDCRLPLKWESFKPSALHILLHHSDCDGSIRWQDCESIAAELERILPLMPTYDGAGSVEVWRDKTQIFIAGLRLAAKDKEDVEFL